MQQLLDQPVEGYSLANVQPGTRKKHSAAAAASALCQMLLYVIEGSLCMVNEWVHESKNKIVKENMW